MLNYCANGPSGYNLTNSLRFRQSASAYLNRTPASAGNRQIFTWSGWVKRGALGSDTTLFSAGTTAPSYDALRFTSDTLQFFQGGGATSAVSTTQVFRDPSAWYHILLAVDTTQATASNRVKIYVNGSQVTALSASYPAQNTSANINNTLVHAVGALWITSAQQYLDGYLAEVNFIDGQALTPSSFGSTNATTGVWQPVKYTGTYGTNGFYLPFTDTSTNTQNYFTYSEDFTNAAWTKGNSSITANTTTAPNSATTASKLIETTSTSQHNIYRSFTESSVTRTLSIYAKVADVSRPYLYMAMSNLSSYDCNAVFNLSTGTVFSTSTANADYTSISSSITSVGNGWYRCILSATKGSVNTTNAPIIGLCDGSGNSFYTGSGTTLGTYIWGAQFNNSATVSPYVYTGSSAQSTAVNNLGRDYSLTTGGYNTWIPNNISTTSGVTYDSMTDVPTLTSATVANYAVINPLSNLDATTLSAGNLNLLSTTNSSSVFGTIGISSGKWYWEVICYDGVMTGVSDTQRSGGTYPGNFANSCAWNTYYTLNTTNTYASGTFTKAGTISGSAGVNGDVIGCALDMDAGTIKYYVNGVVTNSGNAVFTNITGTVYPLFRGALGSTSSVNFGQRGFTYTPPTGYIALNTYNLPTSTIVQGNKYMDATLYTGTGATQTITNAGGFYPDLTWIKSRSNATNNNLFNSVVGATNYLISNATVANAVNANSLTAFNTNGFTLGSDASSIGVNINANTYVAWQWKANSGSFSANTNGSITSYPCVNLTSGFSVVSYIGNGTAGATLGHGLNIAPSFIFTLARSFSGANHLCYHVSLGGGKCIIMDVNNSAFTNIGYWNNTAPTSSVFTLGSSGDVNTNGATYVAYCWSPISGYSAFGSYTGNGSTDGPFVFTNFLPRFVLIKRTDSASNWYIFDTARDTYNVMKDELLPNSTNAEADNSRWIDCLSNGFKIRNDNVGQINANGGTYIYACFASNPFKNSLAR